MVEHIRPSVLVIAGPTASGKSAFAMEKARTCNGVIINADSLQIYKALPQLTAAPTPEDMAHIPHKLYGVLSPNEAITAQGWAQMVLPIIEDTYNQGQQPILVGGNGFYLKTLMEGLSPIPEFPAATRIVVQDLMDRIGIDDFFKQLQDIDPVLCEKIDRHNPQRLMRAMEVYIGSGKPLSYWQSLPTVPLNAALHFETHIMIPERDALYARCNARLETMVKNGVLDEVRAFDDDILAGRVSIESPCLHALGFTAFQEHVRGELDIETALYMAQNETRHYAKRQVTWFRNQMS